MAKLSYLKNHLPVLLVWFALVLLPDFFLRRSVFSGISAISFITYFVGLLASLFLWLTASTLLKKTKAFWLLFLIWFILFPGLAILTNAYFKLLQFEFFSPNIAFLIVHPDYAAELVRNSFGLKAGVLFAIALFAMGFGFARLIRKGASQSSQHLKYTFVLATCFLSLWIVLLDRQTQYSPEPSDLKGIKAIGQGTWMGVKQIRKKTAHSVRFIPSPHALPNDRPDLIFILNETLSASQWAPWNAEPESSPEVFQFLNRYKESVVWFSNAKTASGATNVSMPVILTGLSPDHSLDEFSQAPFLWKEAEAYGYQTALFTSQAYKWLNTDGFYLGKRNSPMTWKIAEDYTNIPRVNDNGVDDPVTIDTAIEFLKKTPVSQPIFLMIQLNSTHEPCYSPELEKNSAVPVYLDRPRRCRAAAKYVSRQMVRFLDELEKSGRLAHSLIIETADHGSQLNLNGPARLDSYYESVASVPLFVHVPEGFSKMFPVEWRNLQNNSKKRVSNYDIFPTFLNMLGKWPEMPDIKQGFRPAISGTSLFSQISDDRPLIMLNTGELRDWKPEGFAIYYLNWKLIAYETMGVQLFDLSQDPGEVKNLWNKDAAPLSPIKQYFRNFILSKAPLKKIFEKSDQVQSPNQITEH